ncbi:hypothetical protein ACT3SP_10820 [Brachybacterium sp. AOP43-C2-M15]|uniref:hypothetical protein n=1 Tax=Brachybacterium sp. AOP43-C2-M15 TaxID=3457661 RepID=UPI0040337B5D
MSAQPADGPATIPSQDDTHHRIHDLLGTVVTALLEEQPGLLAFHDHRPERDRSSGSAWHGLQTLCHVSALLVSSGEPAEAEGATGRLLEVVHEIAASRGMRRRSEHGGHGMAGATWVDASGDLLEVVVGVRTAVRAISAPFLPGSLTPMATTSPASALSPLTPPPRRIR